MLPLSTRHVDEPVLKKKASHCRSCSCLPMCVTVQCVPRHSASATKTRAETGLNACSAQKSCPVVAHWSVHARCTCMDGCATAILLTSHRRISNKGRTFALLCFWAVMLCGDGVCSKHPQEASGWPVQSVDWRARCSLNHGENPAPYE